jgi:hypothetical protein
MANLRQDMGKRVPIESVQYPQNLKLLASQLLSRTLANVLLSRKPWRLHGTVDCWQLTARSLCIKIAKSIQKDLTLKRKQVLALINHWLMGYMVRKD